MGAFWPLNIYFSFKHSLKFYVLLICGSKDALNNYKNI